MENEFDEIVFLWVYYEYDIHLLIGDISENPFCSILIYLHLTLLNNFFLNSLHLL